MYTVYHCDHIKSINTNKELYIFLIKLLSKNNTNCVNKTGINAVLYILESNYVIIMSK